MGIARDEGGVYKSGIEKLVENLVMDAPDEINEAVRDFVEIDERLGKLDKIIANAEEPQVFIGRKSPVTKCSSLAIVASDYNVDGDRVLLVAIGPKRMNYKKTLKVFKNLKHGGKNKRG